MASGLAIIAQDVKERIDKEVRERYARIAGEARLRMRKLEVKAGIEKDGKKALYDPVMHSKMPGIIGDEMTAVQAECQKMLEKLNHQILNAKNYVRGPPKTSSSMRNNSIRSGKRTSLPPP